MDKDLWRIQVEKNKLYDLQINLLIEQIGNLIDIIKDHEEDMMKMAHEINNLKKQISERES